MDQESRDANSLLVELDRGLQSPNIGDQSEAVVRFSSLFQRYPLPILINSACIKLSEAFRFCSNFIRIQICEVFERNQNHLNKVYNVDDFYRNIFTVTTSNDPIARSIALLTLGQLAPIVHSQKSIHHCISDALESTVEWEINSSIACAACFVKQSSEFACNIYPKIVSIVEDNKFSIDVKLRALSVLDHGFYNANDAMTVRTFLVNVINRAKLKKLICSCLTLSTKIAYTSLSHIMPQIDLLLKIFLTASNQLIKLNALRNLKFLAEKSPHIWETNHVIPLIHYLDRALAENEVDLDDHCLCGIISIFCKLLTCQCNFIAHQEKTRIFHQSYELALYTKNGSLCSMAFELLTVVSEEYSYRSIEHASKEQIEDLKTNITSAIRQFLVYSGKMAASTKSKKNSIHQQVHHASPSTKKIYCHIVKLCQFNPDCCAELVELVFQILSNREHNLSKLSPYMTELVCAVVQSRSEQFVTLENWWKLIKSKHAAMSDTNLLNCCVLYFQTLRIVSKQKPDENLVDIISRNRSLWFGYKVARQALRYGHFEIAGLICKQLHEHVTTDTMDFYFKSLERICIAESVLSSTQDLDDNLRSAIPLYEESVSPLRASIGHSNIKNFQLQFLWLRIRVLQAHQTLRQCCKVHTVFPITYKTLLNAIGATRGPLDLNATKHCVIQQMPKIAKEFRYLGDCYNNLSSISFDCDNSTLDYIHLLRYSCIIMADTIDAIFQYGKNLPVINKLLIGNERKLALEHRELEITCNELLELIQLQIIRPGIQSSPDLIEPLISLLKKYSDRILSCTFVYPRNFFQLLQITHIKLAITPQPSSTSGSINLILNNNLVLKVEGLIKNLSKTQAEVRKISKVVISVTINSAKATDINQTLTVQSSATPHNNYFKTEFLIPLKLAGSFIADIDVSIVDVQERLWKTGPNERLNILVS